jgi:HK97 gp10 family phage protein
MKINIKVIGAQLIIKELVKRAKESNNALHKAVTKAALIVEAEAKKLAPVDTGRLRASITHDVRENVLGEIHGRVGTNVDYAIHVEFGSGANYAQNRQPFLNPALSKNFGRIQKIMSNAVVGVWR